MSLEWSKKSHKAVIAEIQKSLEVLNEKNVHVKLNLIPDHADIAGNEIADKLAKQAAEEAEKMPELSTPVTVFDIKAAVQESENIKWQKRWDAGNTGRHLFDLRRSVTVNSNPTSDIRTQRIITQLRTRYCSLNEYKFKAKLKM